MVEIVRRVIWILLALVAVVLAVASAFVDTANWCILFAGIAGALFALSSWPEPSPRYAPRKRCKLRFKH